MQLSDGTIAKPIGMELAQIRIGGYKQFTSGSRSDGGMFEGAPQFELAGLLTALVGQNSSGKTILLEALRFFCHAVKYGSSDYSAEEATKLFGIEYDINHAHIQGVFTVFYEMTTQTKHLVLNVELEWVPLYSYDAGNDEIVVRENISFAVSREKRVRILVTKPNAKIRCHHLSHIVHLRPENYNGSVLYQRDYGILKDIFPQVISFNSKSIMNNELRQSLHQMPDDSEIWKEIDKEIRRIFPFIILDRGASIENLKEPCQMIGKFDKYFNNRQCVPVIVKLTPGTAESFRDGTFLEDIASCGEGVLQCSLLIVSICCAEPNSIITIDEPDAHVFPNAQKLLIDYFHRKLNALHKTGSFCQMVITTHSTEIMQALKLEEIRQIFLCKDTVKPLEIKSLACVGHLLNVMIDVGASILSHSEFVRLGVHRKLLYLEDHDDYNFFSGIIYRIKPELLYLPFTKMRKGGRTQPSQIKQLIREFRQLLPKTSTLHIFVLVDADLRSRSILETEKDEYDAIESDPNFNVKIYYHCWAVREWENWLLSNEDLLYEMLFDLQLHDKEPTISQLRDRIKNQWPTSEPTTTADARTQAPQIPTSKDQFCDWFANELHGYFQRLLEKELTSSQMEGTAIISQQDSNESVRKDGEEFLRNAGVNDEIMKNLGNVSGVIQRSTGYYLKQLDTPKEKGSKNSAKKQKTDVENCRAEWLLYRQLEKPIDFNNVNVRREVTKWIDAKRFFHQLTHGKISTNDKINLDEYWKRAFSLGTADEYNLYARYFNSLNSQQRPTDFEVLVEKFERFVNAA